MLEIFKAETDSPQVLFPPLVPITAIGLALLLEWLAPLNFLPPLFRIDWHLWLGFAVFVAGLWLALHAVWQFRKAQTNVLPTRPTNSIVLEGPYRFTRNPMYLAFLFDVTSLSLIFSLEWGLIFVPVVWFVIDRFIIPKEEAYLRQKFGADYEVLLKSTRRWL